jgi:CYTH domain-containing protein
MNMHIEIERKFLVKGDQWKKTLPGTEYTQGYLMTGEYRTARVRMGGGKSFMTIKGKTEEQTRLEFEYEIPQKDALILLHSLCLQPLIYKTRYLIPQGELCWEVDVFHKENEGLIMAEIELGYPDQPFHIPEWIGEEVTDDLRYYNANLVSNPYQNWE